MTGYESLAKAEHRLKQDIYTLEREKWVASKGRWRWDGGGTILVALIGGAVAFGCAWYESAANRAIERTKHESQLILKAVEPADAGERIDRLKFLVRAGLLSDTTHIIRLSQDSANIPQFSQRRVDLPTLGPVRVSIIRPVGTPTGLSDTISAALRAGGYNNITLDERNQALPENPEVRYYYLADSANARVLATFIREQLMERVQLNNRTGDPGTRSHLPGDLNIYVRR